MNELREWINQKIQDNRQLAYRAALERDWLMDSSANGYVKALQDVLKFMDKDVSS